MEELRTSREVLGELQPVILGRDDNEVLVGRHRRKVGFLTFEKRVSSKELAERLGLGTVEAAKALVRLHGEVKRRFREEEARRLLNAVAEGLVKAGVPEHEVATQFIERKLSPYSKSRTLELLDERFKQPAKVKAGEIASAVREEITCAAPTSEQREGLDLEDLRTIAPSGPISDQTALVEAEEERGPPLCHVCRKPAKTKAERTWIPVHRGACEVKALQLLDSLHEKGVDES